MLTRLSMALISVLGAAGAFAAPAAAEPTPSWGAIATQGASYATAFNHPSRDAAELAARTRCDRTAGRPGACIVSAAFDRACGAVALGNYGEWGTATALTPRAAEQAAATQCNGHLPTEPCKPLVSVCSPG